MLILAKRKCLNIICMFGLFLLRLLDSKNAQKVSSESHKTCAADYNTGEFKFFTKYPSPWPKLVWSTKSYFCQRNSIMWTVEQLWEYKLPAFWHTSTEHKFINLWNYWDLRSRLKCIVSNRLLRWLNYRSNILTPLKSIQCMISVILRPEGGMHVII